MHMHEAHRMKRLPPYLFTIVDNLKKEVEEGGMETINLSMGNPDLAPPAHVVKELKSALSIKGIHKYSKNDEKIEVNLRKAIAKWYYGRFKVKLDPDTEVLPLIGSKEGIAHLSLAFLNNDDLALIPSPAYPIHFNGVIMAGGILYNIPLKEENGFLPDLTKIPRETARLSKLMILGYPHNPTAATCDLKFYQEVVDWARDKDIIIANDNAYSDFVFSQKSAPSILQAKGSRDFCIEFHTLSKSYSMAGWRIAFVVGNKDILSSISKTKSYVDFGMFRAIQKAAITALTGPQAYVKRIVKIYKKRVDLFVDGLNDMGWETPKPEATFYIWTKLPAKFRALTSLEFAELLLRETGVVVSPGTGFGEYGEGYVRMAMVVEEPILKKALKRIKKFLEEKD